MSCTDSEMALQGGDAGLSNAVQESLICIDVQMLGFAKHRKPQRRRPLWLPRSPRTAGCPHSRPLMSHPGTL